MKTLKSVLRVLFLATVCTSIIAACGKEDNPVADEGSSNTVQSKRLKRIYMSVENGDWTKWTGEELIYDESGRLIKEFHYYEGQGGDDGKKYIFVYEGNHVYMKRGNTDVGYAFVLNEEGNAISCIKGNDEMFEFTYTSDGYLAGIEYNSNSDIYHYTYTWEEGNMVKYEFRASNRVEVQTYGYDEEQYQNIGGITPRRTWFYPYIDSLEWAFYAGILGKPSKNLPVSYVSDGRAYDCNYCFTTGWSEEEAEVQGYSFPAYVIE